MIARLLALAVLGDEMRSGLSEPQASEAIPRTPPVKLRHSDGEPAHSGEPSGPEKHESPIISAMPAKFER